MIDEATPKKKRGCLKLFLWGSGGLVGLFVVLVIAATFWENGLKDGCNSGKAEDCETLLDGTTWVGEDFDLDQITNEEYKPKFAAKVEAAKKATISDYENCLNMRAEVNAVQAGLGDESYDCESIKSFVKPADRVKAARAQNLARSCEDQLKPSLHDPRSYRYVDKKFIATGDNGLDLTITYSATNKLGARIQSTHTCSYTF